MVEPRKFREFAELCAQLANDAAAAAKHRAQLMAMAETWRGLAAEAERFEQLIHEMDEAFDTRIEDVAPPSTQRRSH